MIKRKVRLNSSSNSSNGAIVRYNSKGEVVRDKDYISFGSKVISAGSDWKDDDLIKKGYRFEDIIKKRLFCKCLYCDSRFYEVWRSKGICIKRYKNDKCEFIDKNFDKFEY